jgi:hypothetical protein
MHPRRSQRAQPADLPQALRHIMRAAQHECPHGHADALQELTMLAVNKVPGRGIFDPSIRSEEDLYKAIEVVGRKYLELADARAAWRGALDAAALGLERRDDIEHAALQLQAVSDTAYYYAGLAFGLVAVYVYRSS